jgi:hypothetical protein
VTRAAMVLRISADLDLPIDTITERIGWLGTSGSGKTYGAGKLAEEMLKAGAQVLVIDPVGPWWGLRSSADGKRAGFAITVFGGIHADLPLTPESGALVADILVDRGISAVLDVSDMTVGEMHRFVSAFAERFFDRKKRNPTPVHLFLEEAHTFLPQQLPPEPAAAVMLHRMERIVRVGRNYGIGTSQISQLPQAVTKKTLNTVACLFAFGTIGSQERKALAAWFDQNGGGDLAKELPGLPTGTAFAVSPRWLRLTKKLAIAAKQTFDASETPKFGGPPPTPKVLAAVDVEQLRAAMADTIAAAAADDPKALRKRIAELEREVKAKITEHLTKPAPKVETKVVEKPVITESQLKRLEVEMTRGGVRVNAIAEQAKRLYEAMKPITDALQALRAPARAQNIPARATERNAPVPLKNIPQNIPEGEVKLGRCELAILGALAVRRPERLTRNQLTLISGYTNSGGFRNAMSSLRSQGLIRTEIDGLTALTEAGEAHVGHVKTPRHPQEILDHWIGQLGQCERAILNALVGAYPNAVPREELPGLAGYTNSGGYRNALSRLRTLTLAVNDGAGIRASEEIGGAR